METFHYRNAKNCFLIVFLPLLIAAILAATAYVLQIYSAKNGVPFVCFIGLAAFCMISILFREWVGKITRCKHESLKTGDESIEYIFRGGKPVKVRWDDILRLYYITPRGSEKEFFIQSKRSPKDIVFDPSINNFNDLIKIIEGKTSRKFEFEKGFRVKN